MGTPGQQTWEDTLKPDLCFPLITLPEFPVSALDHIIATINESYGGDVKFLTEQRGFCVTVRELNDALPWLTIEGVPGKIEAQLWLSAFGLPQVQLDAFRDRWQQRLQEIFAAWEFGPRVIDFVRITGGEKC